MPSIIVIFINCNFVKNCIFFFVLRGPIKDPGTLWYVVHISILVHQAPFFYAFISNTPCQVTLLNLCSLIFGRTPFDWLRSFTLTSYFGEGYRFRLTTTFSGTQLGHKTRTGYSHKFTLFMSQIWIDTDVAPYIFAFVDRIIESYHKEGFIILVSRENKTCRKFSVCLDEELAI